MELSFYPVGFIPNEKVIKLKEFGFVNETTCSFFSEICKCLVLVKIIKIRLMPNMLSI